MSEAAINKITDKSVTVVRPVALRLTSDDSVLSADGNVEITMPVLPRTVEAPDQSHGDGADDYAKFQQVAEMPLWKELIFLFTVTSGQTFTQSTFAIGTVAPNLMASVFHTSDPGQISWFVASYSLTVGTFILVAGRLGDMYGHKRLYLLGFAWLALWSLLAGINQFMLVQVFFDLCRAMQGIGPAVLIPNGLAILGRSYSPGHRKNMIFAVFGATAPLGFLVGALFSGIVDRYIAWYWSYYLNAIASALMTVVSFLMIPSDSLSGFGAGRAPQSFDWLGSFLGVSGLILFNVAWNQAPSVGWQSPVCIVLLILGVAILTAFYFVEKRVKEPLVPVSAFNPSVLLTLGCTILGWSTFVIWFYYLFLWMQEVEGLDPLQSGLRVLPCVSGAVASLVTGYMMSKTHVSVIMMCATVFFLVPSALAATMRPGQSYWLNMFWQFLLGPFGMDMSFPSATIMLSQSVPRRHQGSAGSLVATVVNYSISLALGFAGTLVSQVSPGRSKSEVQKSCKVSWYMALGFSSLGFLLAVVAIVRWHLEERRKAVSQLEVATEVATEK